MPKLTNEEARALVRRRHPEYQSHHLEWRWLLDSLEGGRAYRDATYGQDTTRFPIRNLVRHKREIPLPDETRTSIYSVPLGLEAMGYDANQYASNDDYEMRRARTPVPTIFREGIEIHLSKIYAKEVDRTRSPDALKAWWNDVDGRGTIFGDWIEQEAAPLFLALGQLDVLVDHPAAMGGAASIRNRADEVKQGLDRAVISIILPGNLLWWTLLPNGQYNECLIRECDDTGGPDVFRYWTVADWTLLDKDGKVVATGEHSYGRVPIERALYRRKPNCRNVGQSRYYGIAERQREIYNRSSELILSDTTQAFPLLQGPEDYIEADGTIPIGPSWLLPKKKNLSGSSVSYEGFDVIDFPKGAAESIRKNIQDLRDDCDRDNCLTKPAGAQGTTGSTVAQSGIAKSIDNETGHDLLTQIAGRLEKFEWAVQALALTVLANGPPKDLEAVVIIYPSSFDLQTPAELSQGLIDFQTTLQAAGGCPDVEIPWLQKMVRQSLRGQAQDSYDAYDAAIEKAVKDAAAMPEPIPPPASPPMIPDMMPSQGATPEDYGLPPPG